MTTVHAFAWTELCLYLFIIGFLRTASRGCGAFGSTLLTYNRASEGREAHKNVSSIIRERFTPYL